ncbi:MAG: hypothetical protein K6G15_00250 [Desulfovibrio sp.]|nr:hypothetical protein [Desulfovibrio sp.]
MVRWGLVCGLTPQIFHRKGYGGHDPEQTTRTLESLSRSIAVAQVSEEALLASRTMGMTVAECLPMQGADSSLILTDHRSFGSEEKDNRFGDQGYALWIAPVFQNLNSFGMQAGNYAVDGHTALGGISFGGDVTLEKSIRLGLMFILGGGFAEVGTFQ